MALTFGDVGAGNVSIWGRETSPEQILVDIGQWALALHFNMGGNEGNHPRVRSSLSHQHARGVNTAPNNTGCARSRGSPEPDVASLEARLAAGVSKS